MRKGWGIALLGAWLWITPFVSAGPAFYAWDNWIVGTITAILGFGIAERRPVEGWPAGLLGSWLFLAGFLPAFQMTAGLWWNSALTGLVLLILGIRAALDIPRPTRAAQDAAATRALSSMSRSVTSYASRRGT